MNKRALLVMSMVVSLALAVVTSISSADPAGVPPTGTTVQGAIPQPPDPSGEFSGRGHHRHSLKAMMEKLGITDAQKKQIRALYVGFRDHTRKARMELMSLKDEKKTMLLSGKIDQQKLAQIDDQIVKLVNEVLRERLKLRRDRLAIMTPEQIERIADWQAEKAFRSRSKRKPWGRTHGGF